MFHSLFHCLSSHPPQWKKDGIPTSSVFHSASTVNEPNSSVSEGLTCTAPDAIPYVYKCRKRP